MDYKERMVEECIELEKKTEKLRAFILSEKIKELYWLDRELLSSQLDAMVKYATILNARIGRL